MKHNDSRSVMKKTIWILSLFLLLSGCALKESAPMTEYTLWATPMQAVSSSRYRTKTLKVSYPQSLKENLSRSIHYSYSLTNRGVYQNSEWSNNLGQLLQGTIIEALDQSRIYKGILSYDSRAYEDYRLESTVYDFSHHVRGESSYAVVSIQFTLIDTNTGKLVKTRKFSYKEPTKTVDARGYVAAVNTVMSRLVRDLAGWLR